MIISCLPRARINNPNQETNGQYDNKTYFVIKALKKLGDNFSSDEIGLQQN